jgi:hypothetical protein
MTFGMHTSVALIAYMALAACLGATNLTLISQSGGQYNYAIQLDPNQGLVFVGGDQIILSGLSGATGATLLSGLVPFFGNPVITPTSVSITDNNAIVFDPVAGGVTIPAFSVTSWVLTNGPVHYQIETANEGTFSGAVQGPVGVPEPVTIFLVGAGLVALGLRRFLLT